MEGCTTKGQWAIREAFLKLRSHTPVHRIRVNRLCELGGVNKSTFYRYYSDVYALQEELEDELIDTFVREINAKQTIYGDPFLFLGL